MDSEELKKRTKLFALAVIRFVESLPRGKTADVMGGQLLRAGTSVAANYRSACRARSRRDFVSKITIVEEEADESSFCSWKQELLTGQRSPGYSARQNNLRRYSLLQEEQLRADRASLNSQLTIRNPRFHFALCTCYSYRRASTGSRLAAFHAG